MTRLVLHPPSRTATSFSSPSSPPPARASLRLGQRLLCSVPRRAVPAPPPSARNERRCRQSPARRRLELLLQFLRLRLRRLRAPPRLFRRHEHRLRSSRRRGLTRRFPEGTRRPESEAGREPTTTPILRRRRPRLRRTPVLRRRPPTLRRTPILRQLPSGFLSLDSRDSFRLGASCDRLAASSSASRVLLGVAAARSAASAASARRRSASSSRRRLSSSSRRRASACCSAPAPRVCAAPPPPGDRRSAAAGAFAASRSLSSAARLSRRRRPPMGAASPAPPPSVAAFEPPRFRAPPRAPRPVSSGNTRARPPRAPIGPKRGVADDPAVGPTPPCLRIRPATAAARCLSASASAPRSASTSVSNAGCATLAADGAAARRTGLDERV